MTVARPAPVSSMRATALITAYDGVICDLDGVVYRGPTAVPGAVEALETMVADGKPIVFATNNASRAPETVGDHLRELGLGADGWSVVTSSQAAAAHLASRLAPRTQVCAVGGPGVAEALLEVGLTPVCAGEVNHADIGAVVQGLGVDVTWSDLAEVGHLVQSGALWVATNLDIMLPTARGPAPGNGALVAAVQATTDARPHVVGKPSADLYDLARGRLDTEARRTLAIGDRLDTDIEGAVEAGMDSLFVLSGASRLRDLAFAAPHARPTYVGFDLTDVLRPALPVRPERCNLASIAPDAVLHVHAEEDRCRQLQALVSTTWYAVDNGRPVSTDAAMWCDLERRLGLDPV